MAINKIDKKIRSQTRFYADKTKKLAKKIREKNSTLNGVLKSLDAIDNKLNNNKEYEKFNNQYKNASDNIEKKRNKLKKLKTKKAKNNLQLEINKELKNKIVANQQLNIISSKNNFSSLHAQKKRKRATYKSIQKTINSLQKQKYTSKDKYNYYRNLGITRNIEKVQRRNRPIIMKRLKNNNKNHYTSLYRTDMMNDTVFYLTEQSPSESNNNTVDSTGIDSKGMVQTNFVSRDSKELSGTYLLQGKNMKDCNNKYNLLQKWASKYEFTIDGFSKWKHAYISSITKNPNADISKNAISLSISFTYAMQAQIQYAKKKKGKKTKAPTKAKKGSHSRGANSIRIKPGMTYGQIAKKHHVSVSKLTKLNHWSATKIPVGKKMKLR